MDVNQEIADATEARQRLWKDGSDPDEAARLTAKIADLYDLKRRERTELHHGNPADVIRRARIESELERLMSQD